jgi:hypothetical protein
MTTPAQKGEREEALEAAERIVQLGDTRSIMDGGELVARALLSSSKAEGEMREALKAHEKWEADLILSDATVPQSLWDCLIEVQALRNEALYPAEPAALSPKEAGK